MMSETQRRAEDTPQWREYLARTSPDHDEEDAAPARDMHWPTAFETLGGPFVLRILLRRELFGEIAAWLESPAYEEAGVSAKDLERMRNDCLITMDSLKNKDAPAEKIAELRRVIGLLENEIQAS